MTRWITFDCYGTLVDWQTGFRQLLKPIVGERVDDVVAAYHRVEPLVEKEHSSSSYKTILRESLARAAGELVPNPDVLAEHWAELPVFDDTESSLAALRAAGWKLGILTNCDNDLFAATRERFPVRIDEVVTAEQVGNYKPDLAHFTEFERRTGVDRGDWVHAAVSYFHDMGPARALGLRRVWVDRERTGQDPSTVSARVTSLAELVTVL
jgi:2-haloacid dehalogenase